MIARERSLCRVASVRDILRMSSAFIFTVSQSPSGWIQIALGSLAAKALAVVVFPAPEAPLRISTENGCIAWPVGYRPDATIDPRLILGSDQDTSVSCVQPVARDGTLDDA